MLDAQEAISRMADDICRLVEERDAARAEVESQLAANRMIITERDAAERERAESRADVVRLRVKRNETQDERDAARAEADALREQLAIERKRHLELSEDYDRQNVVIGELEDTIKRMENALKVAQGQHIDERLKGFLAVISQLADQAQDLLP